jgi:hypothetical protein
MSFQRKGEMMRAIIRRGIFKGCMWTDRLCDTLGLHAAFWIGSIIWECLYPDYWDSEDKYTDEDEEVDHG